MGSFSLYLAPDIDDSLNLTFFSGLFGLSKTMYEIDHTLSKRDDAREAGSTATMLLHIPPMAYLINIGDSRTLLAKKRQNGGFLRGGIFKL